MTNTCFTCSHARIDHHSNVSCDISGCGCKRFVTAEDARYRQLLSDHRAILAVRFGTSGDEPRQLNEIEEIRLRAIRFELDIIDYDSPHGQWLYAKSRELNKLGEKVDQWRSDIEKANGSSERDLVNRGTELALELRDAMLR